MEKDIYLMHLSDNATNHKIAIRIARIATSHFNLLIDIRKLEKSETIRLYFDATRCDKADVERMRAFASGIYWSMIED